MKLHDVHHTFGNILAKTFFPQNGFNSKLKLISP